MHAKWYQLERINEYMRGWTHVCGRWYISGHLLPFTVVLYLLFVVFLLLVLDVKELYILWINAVDWMLF